MGLRQHAPQMSISPVDMCAALQQTYVTWMRPAMDPLQLAPLMSINPVDMCVTVQQTYATWMRPATGHP
jgi:hypothetical protein